MTSVRQRALLLLAFAAVSGMAVAQVPSPGTGSIAAAIDAMPRNLKRAKGPGLQLSIDAAAAAVKTCMDKGGLVSVLVVDSVGEPVVLLSGDGAGVRSQLIARTKATTVIKYKAASGEVAKRAETDPRLKAEVAADPTIGALRGGGFPIMSGSEMIGAIAVSGATGMDEICAEAALAKFAAR